MEIRKISGYAVPFKEITIGDVFLFDKEHYMKMEKFENYCSANAVNLFTGGTSHFLDNERVVPVDNCYLAIE